MASQYPLDDLLSAITDELIAGKDNLEPVLARHNAPNSSASRTQVEGFVRLIRRLNRTLVPVQPSPRFVNRLKAELVGTQEPDLVAQVRGLPPRVRIAAGLVAAAGFVLLLRRRLLGIAPASKDEAEIRVTQ
jgi:hypothetical protein